MDEISKSQRVRVSVLRIDPIPTFRLMLSVDGNCCVLPFVYVSAADAAHDMDVLMGMLIEEGFEETHVPLNDPSFSLGEKGGEHV